MSAAAGLIRDRGKVQDYVALQGDEAGFQEDLRINTRGAAAGKARADLQKEQQILKRDASAEELSRGIDKRNGCAECGLGRRGP